MRGYGHSLDCPPGLRSPRDCARLLLLVWLRHVAIHVKVAGRRWQVHLQALELLRQDDLAR